MTTEQASKLQRGQVVILNDVEHRRITVGKSQILLSDMSVILTTDTGEEINCKAEDLTLEEVACESH